MIGSEGMNIGRSSHCQIENISNKEMMKSGGKGMKGKKKDSGAGGRRGTEHGSTAVEEIRGERQAAS